MSLYVLDTDILSLYQYGHANVCARIAVMDSAHLATTVITVQEQLDGWHAQLSKAKKREDLARVYQRLTDTVRFFARIPLLSFSEAAIDRYEQLKVLKLNMGKMDLRIAAIALECGGVVVTRNKQDFQRVPHLNMEDWSQ